MKEGSDPLKDLMVISKLEVGPVKLEKQRVVIPYKVIQGGKVDTFDLIFRFEEDVFEPTNPVDLNLASMMGAQVALNYGLFCKEIVLRGPFDQHDRRFLIDMAKNTCREIFVKKLLEPNPFLIGKAKSLPPVKLNDYLLARMIFPDPPLGDRSSRTPGVPSVPAGREQTWNIEPRRFAVLSSGGKDSLLSFALLKELGFETHPIFINESGRHWFTALNAYRHFSKEVAGTARVWTNSDRLFAWMLRHFPFIRQDFANLRSDEYPIRLWTVSIFVFSALPLLRKRGIAHLVLGDEYDTTNRSSFKGITHYNGLYDQSIHFDNTMTRYYKRKGWGLDQFSILRPLSEILIERILYERYPHLQRLQVSCHATHAEDEVVRPCGQCEKCRRIVGMLLALGGDPTDCGYSDEQVKSCLMALPLKGVSQEKEAVAQLGYLLGQRGLITSDRLGQVQAMERPEVMKLRFDAERSPMESIPRDIRRPLFSIFLQHTYGSVKKSGRMWIDLNIFSDAGLTHPYLFDDKGLSTDTTVQDAAPSITFPNDFVLGELTWQEAKQRFKEVDIALLPVGSIEQHGPHLPLDTDAYDAEYLAKQVAAACGDPKPLVLPLISYGVSYHHEDFSGTLSVNPDTLSRMTYEIGMGATRNGITKLVIINGHGGNKPALQLAAQMINRDAHIFTCVESGETSDTDISALAETDNDVHSGEIETSMSLATRPEFIKIDKAKKSVPKFSSGFLDFTSKRSVEWFARTAKISSSGVLGDPTKASAEKGKMMWEVTIARLVEFVEHLKKMSLDEIYQRRY